MAIFSKASRQNRLDSIGRMPAAVRMPTGLGETIAASFAETAGNELSISIALDRSFATKQLMQEAERLTGLSSEGLKTPSGATANPRESVGLFRKKYEEYLRDNPGAPEYPVTEAAVNSIIRERREKRRAASGLAKVGETGFISGLARFAGGTAGFLVDPINILSMGIAGFSRGVLATAVKQGAIASGTEVPIQALVQGQRPGIGEKPSLGEAAIAVGSAGVGGAALGGLIAGVRGVFRKPPTTLELLSASKNLPPELRTQKVKDAERVLDYLDQLERSNPFPDTPQGRAAHIQRLQEVYEAFKTGRALDEAFDVPLSRSSQVQVKVKSGEPVGEFMDRVRKSDPEFFQRVDKIKKDIELTQKQLKTLIDRPPEVAAGLEEAAGRLSSLKKDLKKATDKRKIKRIERQINDIESEFPKAEAQFKRQAKKVANFKNKQNKLQKKLSKQLGEQQSLAKKADRKVAKIDPFRKTIIENREIIDRMPDLPEGTKTINDLGQAIRELALSNASRTPKIEAPAGQDSRVLDDLIEETPAEQKARADIEEQQIGELAKLDEGTKFVLSDEAGNTRQVTAKELLEEIKEDRKFISELKSCISGALV